MFDWTRVNCDYDRCDSSGTRRESVETSSDNIYWTNFFNKSNLAKKQLYTFFTHFLFIFKTMYTKELVTLNFGGIRLR